MFGRSIEIFRIFGFPIRLDPTWVPVAALLAWTLSSGIFPVLVPGLAPSVYWSIGVLATLGLFASVVVHEIAHCLVARRFGIPIRGITLFFFGGVAEMVGEPPSARSELLVASAGPAASLGVAGAGWGLTAVATALQAPPALTAMIGYLALTNAVLALFNLVPAFPLDGGRILRSLLWGWRHDLRQATRISSAIGTAFGFVLIALGILRAFRGGDVMGGVWWVLLGLFVRHAAAGAYQQILLRQTLEGQPVSRLMHRDPVAVPRNISLGDWARDYVARYPFQMFPVLDDAGRLMGSIRVERLLEIPEDEMDRQTVGAFAERCSAVNTVAAQSDALRALTLLSEGDTSRLMVVDGDRLTGLVSLKDLLRFLARQTERKGPEAGAGVLTAAPTPDGSRL